MKNLFIATCLLFIFSGTPAQNFGIGGDVMYNFQTESFGAGVRLNFFPNSRISFVPQGSYYFGFNPVHEYYLGMAVEYKFLKARHFRFYLLGHGAYHNWINYNESSLEGAKPNNWDLEGGIGVTTNHCLRPFMEYRYNIKFYETHLRLGLLYVFGCSGGGHGGAKRGGKNKLCPAYD